MVQARLKNDASVLKANKVHENFTETNNILTAGQTVTGDFKNIKGLRRGQPFIYRVFVTKYGEIIYANNVENVKSINEKPEKTMEATEIKLGADAQRSATTIDLAKSEKATDHSRAIGAGVGVLTGFVFAKYRKEGMWKTILFTAIGGVAGYMTAKHLYHAKGATVKTSK